MNEMLEKWFIRVVLCGKEAVKKKKNKLNIKALQKKTTKKEKAENSSYT